MRERRPWRRCPCGGVCHWYETHWVCDADAYTYGYQMDGGCLSEWESDHSPKFAAPGGKR